ncbi:glycosyltransferase family 2 protein [Bifidobacterium aquikefiri]|uniref:glycosyltransferase family 2 protein n=1 Tax=Bifidobacterium aquikefiri TaxID=1653207 RepID=UPI0039EA6473
MLALINNQDYHAEIESITPVNQHGDDVVVIQGWAVDKFRNRFMRVGVEESHAAVTRTNRPDLVQAYELDPSDTPGFTIVVPATASTVTFILETNGQDKKKRISIKSWMRVLYRQRRQSQARHLFQMLTHVWSPRYAKALLHAVQRRVVGESDWYQTWIRKNEKGVHEDAVQQIQALKYKPLISIVVPVYNVDERWLRACIESVRAQWYTNWELCIADDNSSAKHIKPVLEEYKRKDSRIKVVYRTSNGRISKATDSALELATGDYIGFMDNDDELPVHALLEVVKAINADNSIDFLYSDEDKITEEGRRFDPFFKPDYSPHLLLGHNYITHFVVVSKQLRNKVGDLRSEFDGSQDYDFVLRATEQATRVHHIPQMLYHWRTLASSVAGDPRSKMYAYEAGQRAIESALQRRGKKARVTMLENLGTYKIDYEFDEPSVTVVLSSFSREQITFIESNTKYGAVSFIHADEDGFDIANVQSDYVVFLDGVMPQQSLWLHEMVNYSMDNGVAVIGGKIFDAQQRVLNVGVTLRALKSGQPFEMRGQWDEGIGYYFRDLLPRDMFAVTKDCMLVKTREFKDLGGFNTSLAPGLRGIDMCLRINRQAQKTAVWEPYSIFTDIKASHMSIDRKNLLDYVKQHPNVSDPFATAYLPESNTNQDGIKFAVDSVDWKRRNGTVRIMGWAADLHDNEDVDVSVETTDALTLTSLKRFARPDVAYEYPVVPDSPLGFEIILKLDETKLQTSQVAFALNFVTTSDKRSKEIAFSTSTVARSFSMLLRRIKLLRHPRNTLRILLLRYVSPWKQVYDYRRLIARTERYNPRQVRERISQFKLKPQISIVVPVYNVDPHWLMLCVQSVQRQYYKNWQLCLADDCSTDPRVAPLLEQLAHSDKRIKVVLRKENGHISRASNSALKLATGEYIALLDNDDTLAPQALYEVVRRINANPKIDMIYSDEDKIDEKGQRSQPHFKPDFAPDLLLSTNYISHLGVYRKSIVDKIGGFRVGYEGSQDYDLVLRFIEHTDPSRIGHISKVLYHWRTLATSTASAGSAKSYTSDAGLRALESMIARRSLAATVKSAGPNGIYDIDYSIAHQDLVSVIIPTKDGYDNIDRCVHSIIAKTTYSNYEIIVADNGSKNPHMVELYDTFKKQLGERFRVEHIDIPFNFSKINNIAAGRAHGRYLLFLNDDTEVISPNWMAKLVSFAQFDRIGVVGAKLIYPTETIQHAGIVLGLGGVAGHIQVGAPRDDLGYFGRLIENVDYSAVTAACCMVKASDFAKVGGFDEKLAVAYNDVDLCIRIQSLGRNNVWAHEVWLYHFESVTRGYDVKSKQKKTRMDAEGDKLRKRYPELIRNDPYYNPNLSRTSGNYWVRTGKR